MVNPDSAVLDVTQAGFLNADPPCEQATSLHLEVPRNRQLP
jgi:hypothetical protein